LPPAIDGQFPGGPTTPATRGASMSNLEIEWTKVDEAPGLATFSLLPIVEAFVATAGVKMKLKDISLTGRILANFPDKLKPEQKVNDELT
jgi:isocitrate dehydrogenase